MVASSHFGGQNYSELLNLWRKTNRKIKKIASGPHPFLKWAGGKRQLLSQMDEFFPESFSRYIEPFAGGGAVFFYLLPENAILNDKNAELINCYNVIQSYVQELIELLKDHKNKEDYFYNIRSIDRDLEVFNKRSNLQKASRTIYLNRCCYNGLYRVNSKRQFNVPFGRYKNPKFCDSENLLKVNIALKKTKKLNVSFEYCLMVARKGDFVYIDPPYVPLSDTSSFTGYTGSGFGMYEQKILANVFRELDQRGCKLMLSNSDTPFILNLYKEYKVKILKARRAINSDASKRGKINEVLIMNY